MPCRRVRLRSPGIVRVDHGESRELVSLHVLQDVVAVGAGRGQGQGLLAELVVEVLGLARVRLDNVGSTAGAQNNRKGIFKGRPKEALWGGALTKARWK